MPFRVSPLDIESFEPLFGLPDADLAAAGAVRMQVDIKPGFPCRLTLEDAEVGESVLLVNYEHLPVSSPYRSSHAVFVREHARPVGPVDNALPESLAIRLLSIRAFDDSGMMMNADVVRGSEAVATIEGMLENAQVSYLHLHNAKPGCFAARVDRLGRSARA
jgi:hypothetical protein